jgi:hypothetical protein
LPHSGREREREREGKRERTEREYQGQNMLFKGIPPVTYFSN